MLRRFMMKRYFFLGLLVAIVAIGYYFKNHSEAPEKHLWKHWLVNDPIATKTIDNDLWQKFLDKYLVTLPSGQTVVKYSQVTPSDKDQLQQYINLMEQVDISRYNRDQQLAYWINLYNAETVNVILSHYPVNSILDINPTSKLFRGNGPWDEKLLKVKDEALSLNDIEHWIIRPIWNDPRTHYVLNCASMGCPNLSPTAYNGKMINQQLDKAAKLFINSKKGVDIQNDKLVVSHIFVWYDEDFGDEESEVIQHIRVYAEPDLAKKLDTFHRFTAGQYDWTLNDYVKTQEPTKSK